MKTWSTALALVLVLPACDVSAMTQNMHEHVSRSLSAAGVQRVRIENVSGTVTVHGGSDRIRIDAVKNGSDEGQLQRTQVETSSSGGEAVIRTVYNRGNWFGGNGGSVDYQIDVPANVELHVSNVSGAIVIDRVSGDVSASDVSGSVRASLGRVGGGRSVSLKSVSGGISAGLTRSSDVRITAATVSGNITQFIQGSVHKGYVGENSNARLGTGSASMNLSTVSGSITISPQ